MFGPAAVYPLSMVDAVMATPVSRRRCAAMWSSARPDS
ncbi:hypothetical protein LC55x_1591 [Lysobacter capsici]|nr:hypothetical protein LC55x_1591 [Lysobacter capsici]